MPEHHAYDLAPSILLVRDGLANADADRAMARQAGARWRDTVGVDEALRWLDDAAPVDAVVVAVERDHGAAFDRLLDRLDFDACGGRHTGIVAIPAELIDVATARITAAGVVLLADPGQGEVVASLAALLKRGPTPALVSERERDPVRLQRLSEEVGRIARTLAELSGVQEPNPGFRPKPPEVLDEGDFEVSAAMLRATIRGRRLRDQFFDSRLFADPAWDMLLDLAAAKLERRQVAVSSLCIAAAVPATTALRWIKTLVDEGLFVRVADQRDGRRVFIELSDAAHEGVKAYFRALGRAGIVPG